MNIIIGTKNVYHGTLMHVQLWKPIGVIAFYIKTSLFILQPIVCSSKRTYCMPGLAPLMNVIFWDCCDLNITFFGVCYRPYLWTFYGSYGKITTHFEVPLSQMLHDILGHDHVQWLPPLIIYFTKWWPCYQTGSWIFLLVQGLCH